MNIDIFNLKIDFGSHVGEGYVELVVDDETHILTSNKSFSVRSGTKVLVSPVASYGNEFAGWDDILEWMTESIYENSRILTGQIESDVELCIRFKQPDKVVYELPNIQDANSSVETIADEPHYGKLNIRNQSGGSFILRTNDISVMKKSDEFLEYVIEIGTPVQLVASTEHGYEFTEISGNAPWLLSGYGKMCEGVYHVTVGFDEKSVESDDEDGIDEETFDDTTTDHRIQPKSRLNQEQTEISPEHSSYLSFGRIDASKIPVASDLPEISMTSDVPGDPVEILLEFKEGHYKWGPWYYVNDHVFHDLVLLRGTTYKFSVVGDKIEGDILDEHANAYDLSTEGGSGISVTDNLYFTPNENTPNELSYKLRVDSSSIRDSRIQGSVLGKIHIRTGHQYGRLISYGYVKDANVSYKINEQEFTTSSTDTGVFRIGLAPTDVIRSMSLTSGHDALSNVPIRVNYETVDGATQLNALTTLLNRYGRNTQSVHVKQQSLKYNLGINFECDLLNDDPIDQILQGNLQYIVMYKKLIIVNALMSFIEYIGKTNSFNPSTFFGTSELQFGDATMIGELLSKLYNQHQIPETLSSVSEVLANLFGWVNNLDTELYIPNWYKLFTFGRVFEQYYLEELRRTLDGESSSSAMDAWDNFTTKLETASDGVLIPEVPDYAIIDMGTECDRVSSVLLSPIMKVPLTEEFFTEVTGGKTLHINTIRYMYGGVVSAKYGEECACYEISTFPNEYDPNIPIFPGDITNYSYESIDACCSELPDNVYPDPTPATDEVDIFSIKLVESGDSNVMYEKTITTKNHPIEYLGNDEYRLYLSESVTGGGIPEASPGYCIIPKNYATPMEQRYLKLGYNSGTPVKQIFLATLDKTVININFTMMTQRGLMSCYALGDTDLTAGDMVSFSNSPDGKIDGEFLVAAVSSGTLFTIFVNMEASETVDDYTTLTAKMTSFGGTRIYCDVSGLSEGDSVVFDKTTHGLSYNIDSLGVEEGLGNYFSVARVLPTDVKRVVKSHVIEDEDEVVEFMYTGKTQYYSVAGADTSTERVWLTYDPDTSPTGRNNHIISYVQFFYNQLDWES
jgi:hypothetical protein